MTAKQTLAMSDPRAVGGRYLSGYWREEYAVLARHDRNGVAWFTVRWADGHVTNHCTPWDARRDAIVSAPAANLPTGRTIPAANLPTGRTIPARVPTRQRDPWQECADLAMTGWTTH